MKTIIYIDGFNFYYGACRRFGIKWVNPHTLAKILLPGHQIEAIRYFSAHLKPSPLDPGQWSSARNLISSSLRFRY